ncbi:MAG: Ig-like domain-containing protein [Flagellimonas sp.]
MKKHWIIFWVFASLAFQVRAQYVIKSAEELHSLKGLPQEKVYLHHTGPLVFTGEYLYYAFYCFNAQTNRASDISFVGYVALVNQQGEYVLEQKVRLQKGMSHGDFFVNTQIPSGNYKLLGYTQWMKNNGMEQVFKDDLVIINPYQQDQSQLLSDSLEEERTTYDTKQAVDSSVVQIKLEEHRVGTRKKVTLQLKNYKAKLGHGTYTLKVQRKGDIQTKPAKNAMSYARSYLDVKGELDKNVGDSLFLPEQRGELLFGHVTDPQDNPLPNTKMVVSVPGEGFLLKSATTDIHGNFYTYLRKDYKQDRAIIQPIGNTQDIRVSLGTLPNLVALGLEFGDFRLRPSDFDAIKKRSIYNQLENQFLSVKPDSVLLGGPVDLFDGGMPRTVYLDDYTRFPTFQETLVEVVSYAGYRNRGKGDDYIRIAQDLEKYTEEANSYPAIVLFDGVYIPDHEKIKDFDARKIKSISTVPDQFVMARKDYQGIMSVKTMKGDYFETYSPAYGINVPIKKPIPQKSYFEQRYGAEEIDQDNIPDYRRILLWEPQVEISDEDLQFEFYTSDLTGEFEVVLDGFTFYGKPISLKESIWVTNTIDK